MNPLAGERVNAGVTSSRARKSDSSTRVETFTCVHLPEAVANRYADARLNPDQIGLTITHHQAHDGSWQATLNLDDLLLLLDLALNPSAPVIDLHDGHRATRHKLGRAV